MYLNGKNSEVEFNNLQDDIIDNLFFDNLSVSKSKLFIVNDTIQHKVDINNLNIFQIQKKIYLNLVPKFYFQNKDIFLMVQIYFITEAR